MCIMSILQMFCRRGFDKENLICYNTNQDHLVGADRHGKRLC